jgi:5'-nucleotidase
VRIAFDGDAVLFSDEAEQVYQREGLDAFQRHESDRVAAQPLPAGPFKPLLEALHRLQQAASAAAMRIRTALVTARSAPAHERAIRTLMDWHIEVDEAMFLGGLPKGEFLREFEPDFFFDDQTGHVDNAAPHVPSGHVADAAAADALALLDDPPTTCSAGWTTTLSTSMELARLHLAQMAQCPTTRTSASRTTSTSSLAPPCR